MELLSLRTETDLLPDINWLFLIFPTRPLLSYLQMFLSFLLLHFWGLPRIHFNIFSYSSPQNRVPLTFPALWEYDYQSWLKSRPCNTLATCPGCAPQQLGQACCTSSNKTSIEMIPMSEAILFSLKLFKQTIPLQVMTKLWKLVSDTVFFLFLFCHQ